MELNKKEMYCSPEAKTYEVKTEGLICASVPATMDGTWSEDDI